jgi:7-keto-8-aminopelargonate synthetase-like enzyme
MGILAPSVIFPAVAPGRARIRFVITADHDRDQIDFLLKCLAGLRHTSGR